MATVKPRSGQCQGWPRTVARYGPMVVATVKPRGVAMARAVEE